MGIYGIIEALVIRIEMFHLHRLTESPQYGQLAFIRIISELPQSGLQAELVFIRIITESPQSRQLTTIWTLAELAIRRRKNSRSACYWLHLFC